MIAGLGLDTIEVDRVKQYIEKDAGFREMTFSMHEIEYCETKANRFEYYAARFAAKEAFFKALGTGLMEVTNFNEIEITHDANGKPGIQLLAETGQTMAALGITKILVSLSHLKTLATAVVIVEKTGE